MNKVALKIPKMIKILNILKITIIASKPLNLAMLEWYLGLFFFLVIVRTSFGLDPKQDWVLALQAQTINLQSVGKRISLILKKR